MGGEPASTMKSIGGLLTDGTREVVVNYQQRFPERIRLILSHLHNSAIVTRGMNAARTGYIALLDGMTTGHRRISCKQADFLGLHPDCAICFHNAAGLKMPAQPRVDAWRRKTFFRHGRPWMGNFIALLCS